MTPAAHAEELEGHPLLEELEGPVRERDEVRLRVIKEWDQSRDERSDQRTGEDPDLEIVGRPILAASSSMIIWLDLMSSPIAAERNSGSE